MGTSSKTFESVWNIYLLNTRLARVIHLYFRIVYTYICCVFPVAYFPLITAALEIDWSVDGKIHNVQNLWKRWCDTARYVHFPFYLNSSAAFILVKPSCAVMVLPSCMYLYTGNNEACMHLIAHCILIPDFYDASAPSLTSPLTALRASGERFSRVHRHFLENRHHCIIDALNPMNRVIIHPWTH